MGSDDIDNIINFRNSNPSATLGLHRLNSEYFIMAYLPVAKEAYVKINNNKYRMKNLKDNLFSYSSHNEINSYKIIYVDESKYINEIYDPYNFKTTLSDYDIFLYKSGKLYQGYQTFGAHKTKINNIPGVRFILWAPNAVAVSVIGNFNHWTTGMNPMTDVGNSGIWELFIPCIKENEYYKFALKLGNGEINVRTDPFAFYTEKRPRTASITVDIKYKWHDDLWLSKRNDMNCKEPLSIYEIHLGSWKKNNKEFLSYKELADDLIIYLKNMNFNYVEVMPLMEYPLDISWGYQVINYFAPTSRYGKPEDLMYFIDKMHENNIGVIMDWVPAHFPDDEYGLSMYDGTHLYDYSDPLMGRTPDWGTNVFDFGKNEVRSFLISSAMYWLDFYHFDGIRVDAVTLMIYRDFNRNKWLPNIYGDNINLEAISLLKEFNSEAHKNFKGIITVAEESSAYNGITKKIEDGGIGFDYKWNLGWMHDTLDFFSTDPLYRKYNINLITFTVSYAFSEKYILPISHDEVVYGKRSLFSKMPGDSNDKFNNLKLFFSYMFSYPGKKLLFMGTEFGQIEEWDVLNQLHWEELNGNRKLLINMVRDLNDIYQKYGELYHYDNSNEGFEWVDFNDRDNTVISFIRKYKNNEILCVFNLTPVVRENYNIGVNKYSYYDEIFNSDSKLYGGSNIKNNNLHSYERGMHGRKYSIEITLPPLCGLYIRCRNQLPTENAGGLFQEGNKRVTKEALKA